ncbi:MAG: ABC transporter ATP-binding protein [Betaproteobacteria bacterium]|nr:ABC transporter ATP-binding protein [Betaproteobacteria bacterium]
MLEIRDLRAGYGKVDVIRGISLHVDAGECVALVGANGAGKSTTLKCICGLNPIRSGQILFDRERIDGLPGHLIVKRGITMCPEGRQVFPDMSVRENLEMGAHTRGDSNQESDLQSMFDLFPVLRQRERQLAGTLSGGEQEMLAIGRALMAKPKLCIFDEPSLGLAPKVVAEVEQTLRQIRAMGTTILLVEQNAAMALRLADRAYVFEAGEVVLEGTGTALQSNPEVSRAYLGY